MTKTPRPRRSAVALLAACALAGMNAGHAADGLQDPTRPPAVLGGLGAAQPAAGAGPILQTILIARQAGGRHLAVIDGETVRPGDDFHGARVARIAEGEVELVRGRERRVLRLYPQGRQDGAVVPAARAVRR